MALRFHVTNIKHNKSVILCIILALQWRHNEHDSVSNHQPHDCLLNRLFGHRSKKTSMLRVTGLCVGNSPGAGEFPAQMASNAENVSISWRLHEKGTLIWTNAWYGSHVYGIKLKSLKWKFQENSGVFFCILAIYWMSTFNTTNRWKLLPIWVMIGISDVKRQFLTVQRPQSFEVIRM